MCHHQPDQHPDSPAQGQALALIEQGKPRDAALQLEGLAATLRGGARSNALADAAWAWHLAGDSARARSLLGQLTARQLSGASLQRYQLTSAELALADKQPAQALALLKDHGDNVLPALRTRWYLAVPAPCRAPAMPSAPPPSAPAPMPA